ncbi:hypothetical protein [Sphingomonas sp. BK235]|uniref:hypothetical protein n=1 Tax=Sphingomonas sp. BK235 TaxID=2512131 RepID=UPI0010445736|nr:hypothetical protein [Sphingomonas sp. BK235]
MLLTSLSEAALDGVVRDGAVAFAGSKIFVDRELLDAAKTSENRPDRKNLDEVLASGRLYSPEAGVDLLPGVRFTIPHTRSAAPSRVKIRCGDQTLVVLGLIVSKGRELSPDAVAALVTPGQQAPTGVTLSPSRRAEQIGWSLQGGGWIIEDDYLSELHPTEVAQVVPLSQKLRHRDLDGRARGRLEKGRHVREAMRHPLRCHYEAEAEAAAHRPAEAADVNDLGGALLGGERRRSAARKLKCLYRERREGLQRRLAHLWSAEAMAGLALSLFLPDDVDDLALATAAAELGLAPMPLSPWYAGMAKKRGLLLSVTNLTEEVMPEASRRLADLVASTTRP